jgi:hypothetical protein
MQFPDSMGLQLSTVITSSPSVDHRCGNSGFRRILRGPRHVIKIRYADLPAGLHIHTVSRGSDTIIYLLPGLTAAQRQAALRRARSGARMGHGPRLPVAGVLGAVMMDRIRTTIRNGAAAMRGHPAILVPPLVIIVTAAVAYILLVSVTIRMHGPQASGPSGQGTPIAAAVAPPLSRPDDDPGSLPRSASPTASRKSQRPAPRRSRGGATGASPSPSPTPSPTGSKPSPQPSPSPSPTATAGGTNLTGSGAPTAGGSNSGPPSVGGLCLDIGPLGVCLSL